MKAPKISWYLSEASSEDSSQYNATYIDKECYAGDFHSDEDRFEIRLELWNNRWAEESVQAIAPSSNIVISFSTFEDSKLLEICEVSINGSRFEAPEIVGNKGYVRLGRELSGNANDGSSNASDNYVIVTIKFDISNSALKEGLKSLYVDLEHVR